MHHNTDDMVDKLRDRIAVLEGKDADLRSELAMLKSDNEELRSSIVRELLEKDKMREGLDKARERIGELEKREDILERTLDDKWRTRKYIVCREYQFCDMMAIAWRLMDEIDANRELIAKLVAMLEYCGHIETCEMDESRGVPCDCWFENAIAALL